MSVQVLLLWVARIWAGLGALVWGAFLVEHLQEWVIHPPSDQALPPFVIWALVLHAGMVAGLLGTAFQIRTLAGLAVICAAGFFLGVIGVRGIGFFLVTIPPLVYVLALGWKPAIKLQSS